MKQIQKNRLKKLRNSVYKSLNLVFILTFSIVIILLLFLTTIFKDSLEYSINGYYRFDSIKQDDMTVYYLDVGQGDCSFIKFHNNQTMLIDSGTKESVDNLVKILVDYIYKDKPLIIDYVLLTHSDMDHSGGLLDIMNIFQVNNIFRPRIFDTYNGETIDIERDNSLNEKNCIDNSYYHSLINSFYLEPNCNVYFTDKDSCNEFFDEKNLDVKFYFPSKDFYSSVTNEYSPIFNISYKGQNFLFTGDTNDDIEKQVCNNEDLPNVTFLKVAHHGSKYGTSKELLNEVKPQNAIISVGANTYGHPTWNVINRLDDIGSNVYRTDKLGNIIINVGNEGTNIKNTIIDRFYVNIGYFNIGIIYYFIYAIYANIKEKYLFNNVI